MTVLQRLCAQEREKAPTAYDKFFTPGSSWTWYVTEGEKQDGDFLMFGYVVGLEPERATSLSRSSSQ